MSIGQIARNIILANPAKKNQELLDMTLAAAKEAGLDPKTTVACIAWYKNDLRKKGINKLPTEVKRTAEMILAEIEGLQVELEEVQEAEKQELLASAETIEQQIKELLLKQEQLKALQAA